MNKILHSTCWLRHSLAKNLRLKDQREFDWAIKLKTQERELIRRLVTEKRLITSLIDLRFRQKVTSRQVYQDFIQIRNAAEKAADLTRQILLFSQNYPLDYKLLDLNELINSKQPIIRNLTGDTGDAIVTQYHLTENLWLINGDAANVEQVLENLILNARDAMPQGGLLTINTGNILFNEADCREHKDAVPGRFVRLTIHDHGIGMNEATLAKIFEPFFTTHDFTTHKGLGLPVVYGIVKSHRGWIQVTSQMNEGSRFELFFPAETSVQK